MCCCNGMRCIFCGHQVWLKPSSVSYTVWGLFARHAVYQSGFVWCAAAFAEVCAASVLCHSVVKTSACGPCYVVLCPRWLHCPLWYQSDVLAGGWINVSDCAVLHCGQGGLASRQAGHMERVGWEGLLRLELPCRYCNVSTIYRSTPPQSLCLERRCCAYVGHLRMRWPL